MVIYFNYFFLRKWANKLKEILRRFIFRKSSSRKKKKTELSLKKRKEKMCALLEVLYMSVVLCCGKNSRPFGKKKRVMWSSVLTGHCQAQIKCGKWRRLGDFCFVPYTYCWHCQSCWWSIATGSKESAGHSLFLLAIPFSLSFGIDSDDSVGSSVLTAAKINII